MPILAIKNFQKNEYVKNQNGVSFSGAQLYKKLPKKFSGITERAYADGRLFKAKYLNGKKFTSLYENPKGEFSIREYDLMGRLKGVIKKKINGYQKAREYDENKNVILEATVHSSGFSYLSEFYKNGQLKRKVSKYKDGAVVIGFWDKNKILRRKMENFGYMVCKYNFGKDGKLNKQIIDTVLEDGTLRKTFLTADDINYMDIEKSPDKQTTVNFFYRNGNIKKGIVKSPDKSEAEFFYDKNEKLTKKIIRSPDGCESFIYYKDGKYSSMLDYDASGNAVTYFYDTKGNITNTIDINQKGISFEDYSDQDEVMHAFDLTRLTPNTKIVQMMEPNNDRSASFAQLKAAPFKKVVGDMDEFLQKNSN